MLRSPCLLLALAAALGLALSPALAATDPDGDPAAALDSSGPIVAVLADGTELRERVMMKGLRYKWSRTAEFSSRSPDDVDIDVDLSLPARGEQEVQQTEAILELLARSDEDLAQTFGNVMLIGTEEYREDMDEEQVAARAARVREELQNELDVMAGRKAMRVASEGPRTPMEDPQVGSATSNATTADSASGRAELTPEQLQVMAQFANKTSNPSGGGHRKLLGGGGSAEEDEEEDIATYCKDSRTVMNNQIWPHTAQIALGYGVYSTSNTMYSHSCSATLIASSTALSAAHCFFDNDEGKWFNTYHWAPGYDSTEYDPSPNGLWQGCYVVTLKSVFTTQTSYGSTAQLFDYAVMTFHGCNEPIRNGVDPSKPGAGGRSLSGYWPNVPNSALSVMYNRGYPGQFQTCGSGMSCGTRVWGDSGGMSGSTQDYVYSKAITASGGHSGSGTYVYWNQNNKPYVACIAIAIYKCPDENVKYSKELICHKITDIVEDLIQDTSIDF